MKLNGITKDIKLSGILIGILLTSVSYDAFADAMRPTQCCNPGKIYVGLFGGTGESDKFSIRQYGTAFFGVGLGGPLAVDAFGTSNSRSAPIFGAHLGYQLMEILPTPCSNWGVAPAVEWEGYYLRKSTFTSHDVNNNTARLDEHDFLATYPTKTGVFLVNAVLNLNLPCQSRFHPYVGIGFGGAVISISNADALQVAPPEPGVNHFNAHTSDRDATFAVQGKVGLGYDLCRRISLFAEYRRLYLADSNYTFGSTISPGHAETSSWSVQFDHQHYNLGTVGIQFSL